MYDLLIKNAVLCTTGEKKDLGIRDGKIAVIAEAGSICAAGDGAAGSECGTGADGSAPAAKQVIDAEGRLIAPGFVDSHMHFDKALSLGEKESPTLEEAVTNFTEYLTTMTPEEQTADIKRRATEMARMCVKAGTTTLRSHANIEGIIGLRGVLALNEVRKAVRDYVDIKITALPNFYDGPVEQEKRLELIDEAAKNGLVDYIGGAAHLHDNCWELTEKLFALAVKNDLPVDFHTDESDAPDVSDFMHVAELTKKYGYEGRVSCGHVTALNAVDDETAAKAIAMAKDADLQIITLPSCNMYLMGRHDHQPVRRGITRVREFLEAGVNISYASDNVRDPFRPIGNGDMLEEALITAQVAQMATATDLKTVFRMGTFHPARALQLSDYGLSEGCSADLVIFDAKDVPEAIVGLAARRWVIKRGKIVAETVKETSCAF